MDLTAAGQRNPARNWYDHMWVAGPVLEKNRWMKGKTIREVAREQQKGLIDAFLDLVVEEKLETVIRHATGNVDKEVMTQILNYPKAIVGLFRRRSARTVPRRIWL